jgi:hypothetical protein
MPEWCRYLGVLLEIRPSIELLSQMMPEWCRYLGVLLEIRPSMVAIS